MLKLGIHGKRNGGLSAIAIRGLELCLYIIEASDG